MDEIRELLDGVIKSQIKGLENLEAGTQIMSSAVDDLAQLYKLKLEEDKNEASAHEQYERRIMEHTHHDDEAMLQERDVLLKEKQAHDAIKDRWIKLGIDVAGIILPLGLYAAFMARGFKFEETGTYTSGTFKNLLGRFKPTK